MNAPLVWSQTGTNRGVDLLDPKPEMINIAEDVAEGLARIARFAGQVRSGPYSVAQHCCIGADELWRVTGDANLAGAFLLHDAHEALIGDITSPAAAAIIFCAAEAADQRAAALGVNRGAADQFTRRCIREGIETLKTRLDSAIYRAAGMEWPLPESYRAIIKEMDLRMLATERRYLLGPSPYPWGQPVETAKPLRLFGGIQVWPWPTAADEYLTRLRAWLPEAAPRIRNHRRRAA